MATNPFVARRARVTVNVTRQDDTGEQVAESYSFMNHRMRIQVRQGGGQFGNAKVEVFGVPLDTMNLIARLWFETLTPQNTDTLTIDVWNNDLEGGAGGFQPFFEGVITWSAVDASGMPQVKLVIEANAAFALMNQAVSPYANPGPVLLADALATIIEPEGFVVDYSEAAPPYQLVDQRVQGSPLDQVSGLLRQFPSLSWFINLRRLVVRPVNAPFVDEAVPVNVSTGLQGFPVYSTSGLQFSMIFDARIRPGLPVDVTVQEFEFVNRTKWVSAVLAHSLDVNYPNGQWTTAVAANSFGQKGNTE